MDGASGSESATSWSVWRSTCCCPAGWCLGLDGIAYLAWKWI